MQETRRAGSGYGGFRTLWLFETRVRETCLMDNFLPPGLFRMVYVLGAAQGIFLAAVLASRRRNTLPNRLLAVAMLAFSMDLAMAAYQGSSLYQRFPAFIGLDVPLTLLYGPVVYLYVRTLSRGEHRLERKTLLHFGPFLLLTAGLLPFYAWPGAEKLAFLQNPDRYALGDILAVLTPLKIAYCLVYLTLIFLLVRQHERQVRTSSAASDHVSLTWLKNLLTGMVVLAGIATVLYLLEVREYIPVIGMNPDAPYDDLTLLATTVFVYAIGYLGLRQPEIFHPTAAGPVAASASKPQTPDLEKPRYHKSGMDETAAEAHLNALLELMERRRPYRDGDLTPQDLADALGISAHNLSEIMNTRLEQNFYDFVNGYRVREVQKRLRDPASANLTLLAIGLDAGFRSKSSFNAVFKRFTGLTPSEYRKQAEMLV